MDIQTFFKYILFQGSPGIHGSRGETGPVGPVVNTPDMYITVLILFMKYVKMKYCVTPLNTDQL